MSRNWLSYSLYICDVMYQCSRQGLMWKDKCYDMIYYDYDNKQWVLCELGYVLLMKNLLPYLNEACWSMWYLKWQVRYCEWDNVVCLCIVSYIRKLVIRNVWDIWWSSKCERNGFYYNSKINASSRGLLRINGWDRKASF